MYFLRKDKFNQYKIDESIFLPKEDHIIECKKISCVIIIITGSCSLFTFFMIHIMNDEIFNNTLPFL